MRLCPVCLRYFANRVLLVHHVLCAWQGFVDTESSEDAYRSFSQASHDEPMMLSSTLQDFHPIAFVSHSVAHAHSDSQHTLHDSQHMHAQPMKVEAERGSTDGKHRAQHTAHTTVQPSMAVLPTSSPIDSSMSSTLNSAHSPMEFRQQPRE